MKPLAFSTNAFKKHTLEDAIDSIAIAGYGAVELMADMHHAYPPTFKAKAQKLVKRLRDFGMCVSNINAFTHFAEGGDTYHPTWIEDDQKQIDRRVEHTIRCIELAKDVGATTVSIQPGGPLATSSLLHENALEVFGENLARCVDAAKQHEITLAVEPEPGLIIETAQEYWEFKQRFFANEPNVRMNCDVGHLFCVGDDPVAVIRAIPDEIAHVHLEDIGANRVHQHLTPGRGVMKFDQIFAALRDVRYSGQMTVELYPYETTADGVAAAAYQHLSMILAEQEIAPLEF